MTIQAWWLLKKLKKVQQYKDAGFSIDEDFNVSTLFVDEKNIKTESVKFYSNSLQSTLTYLKDCNYIELYESLNGRVLHAGWHWGQFTAGKILSFLFKSIAVPIFIAFVTTLITLWLYGELKLA